MAYQNYGQKNGQGSYGSGSGDSRNARNSPNQDRPDRREIDGDNYTEVAENVIKAIRRNKGKIELTTSQIRNILAMVTDIYNDVMNSAAEELSEEIKERINYLKIKCIYAAGKNAVVKDFMNRADLIRNIELIGSSRRKYILFSRYMESMVAYHRYEGGRDQ